MENDCINTGAHPSHGNELGQAMEAFEIPLRWDDSRP